MKKWLSLILVLMMICTAAMAEENAEPAGNAFDELVVATLTPMDGDFFNGQWSSDSSDLDVRNLIHGYALVVWNSVTGSWDINSRVVNGFVRMKDEEGNHRYMLTLNRDLAYSDGTPITAADYAFSILLGIAPEMTEIGADNAPYARAILGATEYETGITDELTGVELINDHQLAVTIRHEVLPFFYELGMLNYYPYPMAVIAPGCTLEKGETGVRIGNRKNFSAETLRKTVLEEEKGYLSHPSVTSGPYKLISFDKENQTAIFEPNPYYQAKKEVTIPRIPRIVFRCMTESEAISAMTNGEVGLLNKAVDGKLISAGMQAVTEGEGVVAKNYLRSGLSFISFNCERPAMTEAVRKAIAHIVDKDGFIGEYVGDYGTRVDGYYGIGQWMYGLLNGTGGYPGRIPAEDAPAEEKAAYEEQVAAWNELAGRGMGALTVYNRDPAAAIKALEEDGWILNEQGQPYTQGTDPVRCKQTEEGIVSLRLRMLCGEESETKDLFIKYMADPLKEAGIELTVEAVPFESLLASYNAAGDRDCDMVFLGTNFGEVFDPALSFACGENMTGMNRTRIRDEELYLKAMALHQTSPGDITGYCERWVEFEARWTEVLPCLPLYSNVYFDFHTELLHNYSIATSMSWGKAIEEAYMGDVLPGETEGGTGGIWFRRSAKPQ